MTLDEDTLITEIHAAVVRAGGGKASIAAAAAVKAIVQLYGGSRVYVPAPPDTALMRRNADIRARRDSGVSVTALASQFDLSEQMIRRICRTA